MADGIIATIRADHIDWSRTIDVTDGILSRSADEVRRLQDYDYSTDDLAPLPLLEEARRAFHLAFGDQRQGGLTFGYSVAVEESISSYFDVEGVEEVTERMLADARAQRSSRQRSR